jgi:hypothetical protein
VVHEPVRRAAEHERTHVGAAAGADTTSAPTSVASAARARPARLRLPDNRVCFDAGFPQPLYTLGRRGRLTHGRVVQPLDGRLDDPGGPCHPSCVSRLPSGLPARSDKRARLGEQPGHRIQYGRGVRRAVVNDQDARGSANRSIGFAARDGRRRTHH